MIRGNQKNKFRRKRIINITFHKKGCYKGNVVFPLTITNFLHESLESVHILEHLVSSNY